MRTQTVFRWWYAAGIGALWLLMACGAQTADANGSTPPAALPQEATQAISHTPFFEAYQRCGGAQGAGEILVGPAWWQNQWLMITRHMVFVLDTQGVHPLPLNFPEEPPAKVKNDPRYVYEHGHNVVRAFKEFMQSRGGEACMGKPVGEFLETPSESNVYCQPFEYLTLCSRREDKVNPTPSIFIKPLGEDFYYQHHGEWKNKLTTMLASDENWRLMPAISRSDTSTSLHLDITSTWKNGPLPSTAVLVIQVQDVINGNDRGITYYVDMVPASELTDNGWAYDLPIDDIPPGPHHFSLSVCILFQGQQVTCNEDGVRFESGR